LQTKPGSTSIESYLSAQYSPVQRVRILQSNERWGEHRHRDQRSRRRSRALFPIAHRDFSVVPSGETSGPVGAFFMLIESGHARRDAVSGARRTLGGQFQTSAART
jgi:hypothetical protein